MLMSACSSTTKGLGADPLDRDRIEAAARVVPHPRRAGPDRQDRRQLNTPSQKDGRPYHVRADLRGYALACRLRRFGAG